MDSATQLLIAAGADVTPANVIDAVRLRLSLSGMTPASLANASQMSYRRIDFFLHGDKSRLPPHGMYMDVVRGLGFTKADAEYSIWHQAWHYTDDRRRRSQQVIVTGDNANVSVVGETNGSSEASTGLAEQRQNFYFRFLGHAMLHANIAFLLAMLFTAVGALITIWGAVMLLLHAGDTTVDYTPVIATLSGLVVAGGGGAFALHAHKTRVHLTVRADQVREDIQCDVAFERATGLIDRVADADLKDRLLSLTAVKELGLSPTPIDLNKHLPVKGIDSQRAAELESRDNQ